MAVHCTTPGGAIHIVVRMNGVLWSWAVYNLCDSTW